MFVSHFGALAEELTQPGDAALLLLSYEPSRRVIGICITVSWLLVIILASIVPGSLQDGGHSFVSASVLRPAHNLLNPRARKYGWSGAWCWISSYHSYQLDKVYLLVRKPCCKWGPGSQTYKQFFLQHVWIFMVGIVVILVYRAIAIKLLIGDQRLSGTVTSTGYGSVARSMLCFPLVYLCTV